MTKAMDVYIRELLEKISGVIEDTVRYWPQDWKDEFACRLVAWSRTHLTLVAGDVVPQSVEIKSDSSDAAQRT